jgi:hypothetical protein
MIRIKCPAPIPALSIVSGITLVRKQVLKIVAVAITYIP